MVRQGEQQVGITGDLKRRTDHHARTGWVLVETIGPMLGSIAYQKELLVKRWLSREIGTIAGTTESWSTAKLEVHTLHELLSLAAASEAQPKLSADGALAS